MDFTKIVDACTKQHRRYRKALQTLGDKNILAFSPPGVGKTWAAVVDDYKAHVDQAIIAITMSLTLPMFELRGTMMVNEDGGASWMDGPGAAAAREAYARLVVNDIHLWSDDCEGFMFFLGDDRTIARYALPNPAREVLYLSSGLQLVGTSNERPEALPEPVRDRFGYRFYIGGPSAEAIESLSPDIRDAAIKTSFIPESDFGGKVNRLGTKQFSPSETPYISFRDWKNFDDARNMGFSKTEAAISVFGEEQGKSFVRDFIASAAKNGTAK